MTTQFNLTTSPAFGVVNTANRFAAAFDTLKKSTQRSLDEAVAEVEGLRQAEKMRLLCALNDQEMRQIVLECELEYHRIHQALKAKEVLWLKAFMAVSHYQYALTEEALCALEAAIAKL